MDYDINDLLYKLGLNELQDKKELRWYYIDAAEPDVSGCAHARFANDGRKLIVELNHHFKNTDEFDGEIGEMLSETITLHARRIGDSPIFRISKVAFDGMEYDADDTGMIELCCGMFYARALKINEIMVGQRYQTAIAEFESAEEKIRKKQETRRRMIEETVKAADNMVGVIVPFRPRSDAPLQRI